MYGSSYGLRVQQNAFGIEQQRLVSPSEVVARLYHQSGHGRKSQPLDVLSGLVVGAKTALGFGLLFRPLLFVSHYPVANADQRGMR